MAVQSDRLTYYPCTTVLRVREGREKLDLRAFMSFHQSLPTVPEHSIIIAHESIRTTKLTPDADL